MFGLHKFSCEMKVHFARIFGSIKYGVNMSVNVTTERMNGFFLPSILIYEFSIRLYVCLPFSSFWLGRMSKNFFVLRSIYGQIEYTHTLIAHKWVMVFLSAYVHKQREYMQTQKHKIYIKYIHLSVCAVSCSHHWFSLTAYDLTGL